MTEITGLRQALERQQAPLVEALRRLASIPSVMNEGEAGTLFGAAVDQALRTALEIAGELGLRPQVGGNGAYGWAETGQGERLVGVLGHVDVVPAGNLDEWRTPPFSPQVVDGRIFGRGVQDDKGPTLAALFAARALMEAGVTFNRRLRFIFGTDEENLWRCMKAYLAAEEIPEIGFTPDAKFPLIYAEKGLLQVVLEAENRSGLALTGGEAFNAVPALIDYRGPAAEAAQAALQRLGFAHEAIPGGVRVLGKAAHAQVTEEGVNAICRLALALDVAGVRSQAIDFLAAEVGEDPFARRIFGELQDAETGRLKFNVGKIELADHERLFIDMRLPVSVTREAVVEQLGAAAARYGLRLRQHDWMAPIHIPHESFLVQTLLRVYRETSGDVASTAEISGGATYARAMPNCVAFGAVFPGRQKVEHQPNEHVLLEDLFRAMEIYARAIFELTR